MATPISNSRLPDTKRHTRRMLVCLDRSTSAEVCVPYAISLAKTFGSAVTLLHVMPAHPEHAGPQTNDALGWEISRQEARGYLDRIEKEVSAALGHAVDVRLEQGRPAERIIDLAHEIGADLTVLGSHGEGAAAAWNLGSTARQVLALVQGSVFVAHGASTPPADVSPKHILVPLDGSLRTESVLPAAARLATAHDAKMLLVHVVAEPVQTALLDAPEDMELAQKFASRLESAARRYLERMQQRLAHEGLAVQALVRTNPNVSQCILEISQKERADLIVLSAHGSTCNAARSFGSVANYLLTHSTVPLLVLQDLPESDVHQSWSIDTKNAPPPVRGNYASENT